MRQLLIALALLASSFAILPAASAECNATDPSCNLYPCNLVKVCDPCEIGNGFLCDPCSIDNGRICDPQVPQVPNDKPYVRHNADGSETIGLRTCNSSNFCNDDDLVTVPAVHAPTITTYARQNADGSTTYGYTECQGTTCSDHDLATVPAATTCFAYNPDALTNACVVVGSTSEPVPVPTVGTHSQPVCVIGPECVNAPVPDVGIVWVPVDVPTLGGYVEATVLCGAAGSFCRVTL